jgi:hypothetical protein
MSEDAHPTGRAPECSRGEVDNHRPSSSAVRSAKHRNDRCRSIRVTYQVTLSTSEHDGIRILRAALKVLWRRFGLRCLRIEQVTAEDRPW